MYVKKPGSAEAGNIALTKRAFDSADYYGRRSISHKTTRMWRGLSRGRPNPQHVAAETHTANLDGPCSYSVGWWAADERVLGYSSLIPGRHATKIATPRSSPSRIRAIGQSVFRLRM